MKRLKIGKSTFYAQYRNRPDFPVLDVGGVIRVPAALLEAWIARQVEQRMHMLAQS